jgi:transposase
VQLRRELPQTPGPVVANELEVKFRLPGVKELSWLLFRQGKELNQTEQALLTFVRAENELEKAWELSQQFRELLQEKNVTKFHNWLAACLASEITDLVTFAQGLQRDQAAVEAGMSSYLSNGQTEGRVNKLKLIKRQLYGRGSFELLRHKVLLAG